MLYCCPGVDAYTQCLWRQIAAATDGRRAGAFIWRFLRIRFAHGGRLPPLRRMPMLYCCPGVDAYTQCLWRQIAAATDGRRAGAFIWCFLRIRFAHGGRLPPLRMSAVILLQNRFILRICNENGGLEGRRIGGAKLRPVILSLSLTGSFFLIRTPLPSRARALCPCSRTGRSS